MPETQPTPDPADSAQMTEGAILLLLTDSDEQRPWSVEEIIREFGGRNAAIDALASLHGAGLIHRTTDDFVFATRAAIRAGEIDI